ncbi:diacylglycerol/lipid kinase family protein [Candidatus Neomarinimicrobiota bacterium]
MKRLYLVVNPQGGKKNGKAVLSEVKPRFEAAGIDITIRETEHVGHAREIVQEVDFKDLDGLCAIGGDGTMHEIINGMLSRPDKLTLPLGQIPAGTGNSFLYGFDCHTPEDAMSHILAGITKPVDVAQVTLGEKKLYAFNIIGWGMVTDILVQSERLRWLGENRYTVASAIEVLKGKRRQAKLIVDGKESNSRFNFILACNTQYTGKGMRMAPFADVADGLIDLVIVRKATRLQMLRLLPKVFDGSHVESPLLEYVKTKQYALIPEVDEIINIDGELLEKSTIRVEMIPHAIQVFV